MNTNTDFELLWQGSVQKWQGSVQKETYRICGRRSDQAMLVEVQLADLLGGVAWHTIGGDTRDAILRAVLVRLLFKIPTP